MQRNNKHYFAARAKKALLRLKSGKGSVLFFIVAIMTVLVVMASAVYYAVNSSRQQIEVKYDGEQAYQSALAINDIITAYLNKNIDSTLGGAVSGLSTGESITTSGSGTDGFAIIAEGVGSYKATITKIAEDDEKQIIQIDTEAIVNGEKQKVTSIGSILVSDDDTEFAGFDKFFTSTGYAPKDVAITGTSIVSPMYFNNKFAMIGPGVSDYSGTIYLGAEIVSAGTLSLGTFTFNGNTFDIVVGQNFYAHGVPGTINLNGGNIYVGGDTMRSLNGNVLDNDTDMYVIGDLADATNGTSNNAGCEIYVNGNMYVGIGTHTGALRVNGDLFIDSQVVPESVLGSDVVVGGRIYYPKSWEDDYRYNRFMTAFNNHNYSCAELVKYDDTGIIFNVFQDKYNSSVKYAAGLNQLKIYAQQVYAQTGKEPANSDVWGHNELAGALSVDVVRQTINSKVGDEKYAIWDMRNKFYENSGALKPEFKPINYEFTQDAKTITDSRFADNGSTNRRLIVNADDFKSSSPSDKNSYVVMGSLTNQGGNEYAWFNSNIVFDTTSSTSSTGYRNIYVLLPPNCKMTKSESDGSLTFDTSCSEDEYNCFRWINNTNGTFSVLIKGKGSVVFVVDKGTSFYLQSTVYMGHYNIAEKLAPAAFKDDTSVESSKVCDAVYSKSVDETAEFLFDENGYINDEFRAAYPNVHNNVFVVSMDKNSDINFDSYGNLFCGFVYAPYMTIQIKNSFGGFIGGIIASDYFMAGSKKYIASIPYDYFDQYSEVTSSMTEKEKDKARRKYFQNLVQNSGGYSGNIDFSKTDHRSWRLYGYN